MAVLVWPTLNGLRRRVSVVVGPSVPHLRLRTTPVRAASARPESDESSRCCICPEAKEHATLSSHEGTAQVLVDNRDYRAAFVTVFAFDLTAWLDMGEAVTVVSASVSGMR